MSSPLAHANGYIHISTSMFFALEGPFIHLAPVNGFLPPGHNFFLIALGAPGAFCTIRIYVLLRLAPSGINSELPTSRRALSSSACKLCGYIYIHHALVDRIFVKLLDLQGPRRYTNILLSLGWRPRGYIWSTIPTAFGMIVGRSEDIAADLSL